MVDLNSQWLRSFTVLCEERHFTRAAQRLNITQPGMSQHIAKLEAQLGTALIARETPGFALTDAGEKTLVMARARWREERELRESLDDRDPDRGTLRVACSGSFALLLYPSLIAWMKAAPGLSAHLTAAPAQTIVSGVLAGEFDVGILPDLPRQPRLKSEYLGAEPLDLILPAEWSGRLPEFDDLQSLGLIAHPDAHAYADAVIGANYADDYRGADRLRVRSRVNQIGQIPAPVAQGVGYSILPRSGILAFPDQSALATVRFPEPDLLPLHLVALDRETRPPRIEKLTALIRDVAEKLAIRQP